MILRSVLEDCLYLNWALPRSMLPPAPKPLRYDVREWEGGKAVFATALLFRQRGFRLDRLPVVRLGYPQFQLQVCTLDPEANPSVLVRSVLLPAWVAPGARWIAGQPARSADLSYPRNGATERVLWNVDRQQSLAVETEPSSPCVGEGPVLGPWERTVSYFCHRPMAYAATRRGLRRMELDTERVDVMPVKAEIEDHRLLASCLSGRLAENGSPASPEWPRIHSAWLCSPMVASLVLGHVRNGTVGTQEIPIPG